MGFQTTVIVLNDAVHEIEEDPHFGRSIARAVRALPCEGGVHVGSGNHCTAALVLETHHASSNVLVLAGGNRAKIVAPYVSAAAGEDPVLLLKELAKSLGYRLVKRPSSDQS